jgi:hypothetical protein
MIQTVTKYLQCGFLFTSHSWVPEGGRDSSVGIATGYGLDGLGSIPGMSKRFLSPSRRPDRLWTPPKPRIQWVPATLSPGLKRLGHDADHSTPSSVEVMNGGAISPLLHMPHGIVLNYIIKYKDRCSFMLGSNYITSNEDKTVYTSEAK